MKAHLLCAVPGQKRLLHGFEHKTKCHVRMLYYLTSWHKKILTIFERNYYLRIFSAMAVKKRLHFFTQAFQGKRARLNFGFVQVFRLQSQIALKLVQAHIWDIEECLFTSFFFTILCLEGIYFFMMPGGGSNEGDGSSMSASSEVSTPVAVEVGSLQPFQVKGDPHSDSQRWRKWKRAFQLYVLGKGITNDSQKRGLLLHTAGLDVQEVYFTLVPDGAETNYAETFKVLDDYFIPKANVPFERHLFRQISQSSEETVDQFVCRLRQRAASCEFGEREDEYIRSID